MKDIIMQKNHIFLLLCCTLVLGACQDKVAESPKSNSSNSIGDQAVQMRQKADGAASQVQDHLNQGSQQIEQQTK